MKRIIPYANLIVGIFGILITISTTPDLLGALGAITGKAKIPFEMQGTTTAIRLYMVLFLYCSLLLLVTMGLAPIVSSALTHMGAVSPTHVALRLILGTAIFSASMTILVMRGQGWATTLVAAITLGIMSALAASERNKSVFWWVFAGGLLVMLVALIVDFAPHSTR